MYCKRAAAGAAGAAIDGLAKGPVVGKPPVNESVEMLMLSQKIDSDASLVRTAGIL